MMMSIPPPPHATLIWSPLYQHYELYADGTRKLYFSPKDEEAFCAWAETHTSFAFVDQAGQISLLKVARMRGSDYWYAYHKQGQMPGDLLGNQRNSGLALDARFPQSPFLSRISVMPLPYHAAILFSSSESRVQRPY